MAAPNTKGSILLAALALPGLAAQAESLPETSVISVSYLRYHDWQKGLDREGVHSPSVYLLTPIAGQWSLEGSVTSDHVSGASPRYHTAVSGASHMSDERLGADVRVTRYLANASVSAGAAYSNEHDYRSVATSLAASVTSEDHNTTGGLSFGVANDTINPVNLLVVNARRHTVDTMVSLERVLSRRDVVKADLTHSTGHGYYSDPYKYVDNRPDARDQNNLLLRWNHAFEHAAMRLSYRYYRDSFGIHAHTVGGELEHGIGGGWSLTPSLRLYTQTAASFYAPPVYDKDFGPPFPPGYQFGANALTSADQRLSAFDAATIGLKVEKQLGSGYAVSLKAERYRQRASGLANLEASLWQLGISKQW